MREEFQFMIVAGEVSGDAHGAKLVAALRSARPDADLAFFGAVSHAMRAAGVEEIVNSDDLSVIGLPEIARSLPLFIRAFSELKRAAASRRPDAVILIDFPDFNLKLARSLKRQGFTVIYYISPQLWAWRKYRIRTIRKYVDLVIAILPFEKAWYERQGIGHVEYVGSPLTREVNASCSKSEFCSRHAIDEARPIVALLPGSRHKEIVRILPEMLKSAALIAEEQPSVQFLIALAGVRTFSEVEDAFTEIGTDHAGLRERVKTIAGETYDVLNAADAAAVASGTATLEAGIIGTPMAIVYKTSRLNYKLLRPLINVEHFGLINLIAEKRIAREMIQDDLMPASLAAELERLLQPNENREARKALKEAVEKLGHGGASARAARHILTLVEEGRRKTTAAVRASRS